MLHPHRLVLVVGLAVAFSACSRPASEPSSTEPAEEGAAPAAPAASDAAASEEVGALRRPAIRLLEAGEEPRQVLRFQWGEDEPRQVVTEVRVTQSVEADGQAQPPVPNAPIRSIMRLEPAPQEGAAGRYRYTLSGIEIVDTQDVPPAMISLLRSSLENMPTLAGAITLNEQGVLTHLVQDRQAQQAGGMPMVQDDLLRDLAGLPLPEEPIGPGARWVVVSQVEAHGVTVTQEVTYLLGAVREGTWEITWAITQEAASQEIEIPDVPADGPRVMLERLSAAGTGSAEVTPGRAAVPQFQTVALEMHVRADNPQPGAITRMITRQEATRRVVVEPIPDAPPAETEAAPLAE